MTANTFLCASASLNRRSENVVIHPLIVAELELGNRHKGQSLGNKPDRHALNNSLTRMALCGL